MKWSKYILVQNEHKVRRSLRGSWSVRLLHIIGRGASCCLTNVCQCVRGSGIRVAISCLLWLNPVE